jgi:GNAT superfamily N-acetyltransferase
MEPRGTEVELESLTVEMLGADAEWWAIYDGSFPPAEREPREAIVRSLSTKVGAAARARAAGRTVGLATVHLLRQHPCVFLVYLAVAPQCRRTGIGGPLLEYAWSRGREDLRGGGCADARGLVWEVDRPAGVPPGDERTRREKRIAFFQRLGGQVLPHPYTQPPVDGVTAVPMHLMYRPVAGGSLPDADGVRELVSAIYFEKYAAINGIATGVLEGLRGQ